MDSIITNSYPLHFNKTAYKKLNNFVKENFENNNNEIENCSSKSNYKKYLMNNVKDTRAY